MNQFATSHPPPGVARRGAGLLSGRWRTLEVPAPPLRGLAGELDVTHRIQERSIALQGDVPPSQVSSCSRGVKKLLVFVGQILKIDGRSRRWLDRPHRVYRSARHRNRGVYRHDNPGVPGREVYDLMLPHDFRQCVEFFGGNAGDSFPPCRRRRGGGLLVRGRLAAGHAASVTIGESSFAP